MVQQVLITYGEDGKAEHWKCANGHVLRCVSSIADDNTVDADWAREVLNRYGHMVPHPGDHILPEEPLRPNIDFEAEDAFDQALSSPELQRMFNTIVVDAVNHHVGTAFTPDDVINSSSWFGDRPAVKITGRQVSIHAASGACTDLKRLSSGDFLRYGFKDFAEDFIDTKGVVCMSAEDLLDTPKPRPVSRRPNR